VRALHLWKRECVCLCPCTNSYDGIPVWRMLTYADVCWRMLTRVVHELLRRNTSVRRYDIPAYVSIRQHTSAYVSIRQHTTECISIRRNSSAYVSIRQHTSMRRYDIPLQLLCWRMLTYAGVCWRMLTYADVCWRMQWRRPRSLRASRHTYAGVCWRMLTYADVCWRMQWRRPRSLRASRHTNASPILV
jgi:hypothetical protein